MAKTNSKKNKAQQTINVEQMQQAPAAEQAKAQAKYRKMVEFTVLLTAMEYATEKAQLIKLPQENGEAIKIWVSKSQAQFKPDGSNPGQMICKLPAWIFFKAGLDKHFKINRWANKAI